MHRFSIVALEPVREINPAESLRAGNVLAEQSVQPCVIGILHGQRGIAFVGRDIAIGSQWLHEVQEFGYSVQRRVRAGPEVIGSLDQHLLSWKECVQASQLVSV